MRGNVSWILRSRSKRSALAVRESEVGRRPAASSEPESDRKATHTPPPDCGKRARWRDSRSHLPVGHLGSHLLRPSRASHSPLAKRRWHWRTAVPSQFYVGVCGFKLAFVRLRQPHSGPTVMDWDKIWIPEPSFSHGQGKSKQEHQFLQAPSMLVTRSGGGGGGAFAYFVSPGFLEQVSRTSHFGNWLCKTKLLGSGKMAQWIKCLAHTHEIKSSNP